MSDLLEHENFDLVIPTNDDVMLPIVKHRESLQKKTKLAIPSDEAFVCAYDKSQTNKLAQRLQIPVPGEVLVSGQQNLADLNVDLTFPLIVKPVSSVVATDSGTILLHASYAYSKGQLLDKLNDLLPVTPALAQEYFVGKGIGVEVLADKGHILCALQHARVHEPIYGGGSSYRKTVPLEPRLLACAEKLLSALRWTGVAMIEFKYNESTNQFVMLEINGRFWGSLPLAIAAGMDFPYYLYQLLVESKKTFPRTYKKDIYCRNLRLDGYWFLQNMRTRPSKYNNALPFSKLLYEPLNILLLREHYDTCTLDDLYPGIKEIAAILQIAKQQLQSVCTPYLLRLRRAKQAQQKYLKRICAKSPPNVCFVCKGNICRGPFAEAYLKKISAKKACQVKVESAGYYQKESRPSPTDATCAAQKFDIDLTQHRSRIVSAETMSRSDIVFAFDIHNWVFLRKKFRRHRAKVCFLGSLTTQPKIQIISDPYGKGMKAFEHTYSAVARLIDSFADTLIPTSG